MLTPVPVLARALALGLVLLLSSLPLRAMEAKEAPMLADLVAAGSLPPLSERLPSAPLIRQPVEDQTLGRYGGQLDMLMSTTKDAKLMVVYGYARLVGYGSDLVLRPDILERVEVEEGRIFTLHLRPGHRWSDGHPFTTEDFRYYWEDIKNNDLVAPAGPPQELVVDGVPAEVEVLDETTIRYSWPKPNPTFLPALAKASPLYIYAPAHYMKQFHADYADEAELLAMAEARGMTSWAALHNRIYRPYRNADEKVPTLQPWVRSADSTDTRLVFTRNPYFHRVDTEGRQLPYLDQVVMRITESRMVPLQTATGQTDLQARYLSFKDIRALKAAEAREPYTLRVWYDGRGSDVALYPNLNTTDAVWGPLVRDVRFRRALSLAVDRGKINQVLYFNVGQPADNSLLADSTLSQEDTLSPWATHDPAAANSLLDEMGLTERDSDGLRLLPNGEPMRLVVEMEGGNKAFVDTLQLIKDDWYEIGVELVTVERQREVFRDRVQTGQTVMSVWSGLENAIPDASTEPLEFAPTRQAQLQWPQWGLHTESGGSHGTPITDNPAAERLLSLYQAWFDAADDEARAALWAEIIALHEDQVFSIGTIAKVPQIVVVHQDLRNLPETALYNWDPGAHFGIHQLDMVYWAEGAATGN